METKPSIVSGLLGIDRRWGADPRFADEIRDMRYNTAHGSWESAGGSKRLHPAGLSDPFSGVGAIQSMHHFTQHNGARAWLIYEGGNGTLYAYNPSTAARSGSPGDVARDRGNDAQTDRAVLTTPWQRSQSATWGDYFYIVNGINRPLVFDGYIWDNAGFSQPAGQPTATVLTKPLGVTEEYTFGGLLFLKTISPGLGPVPTSANTSYKCAYRWRVAFRNARGEISGFSSASVDARFSNEALETSATGTADPLTQGAHFVYVGLPLGGSEVVGRIIYRTQNMVDSSGNDVVGRGDQFYYHSEIPDNSTTGFIDGVDDSKLGSLLDDLQFGEFPAGAKLIAPFKNTMFVVGSEMAKVRFSRPGHPEMFPPDNVIDLGDADLGPITGMYPTRNALVVFKALGVYIIKGDPVNGFFAQIITRTVGCAAPNTAKEVPNVGLVFLGQSGVFCLQGTLENEGTQTRVICLSDGIRDQIGRLNRSALIGACATIYHRDEEYWLCVPEIGKDSNNLVLIYHYNIGQWSYRRDFPVSCILETSDHRQYLLYASWDTTSASTKGIFVYSAAFADKNGVAIAPLYRTGWIDAAGGTWRALKPNEIMARVGLHGNNTMALEVHSNRKNGAWPPGDVPKQQYKEDEVPVYGSCVYDGAATWQALRPGTIRWPISAPKQAMVHEVRASFSPASGKRWMSILAVDLEVPRDDPSGKPTTYSDKGGR